MPFYTVILNDSSKSVILAETLEELEVEMTENYSTEFKNEVKEVHWVDRTLHCSMDYKSREITRNIATADINPNGYRN
ncbi:hypothetical protein [Mongoliibacter ruber]|uniref:Uncharacterized protein n=1 Tax=Mongoliibacter ruber TaxID=1750599 RepID=A0A2T0WJZ4_9BACT|nr:hypothetical protein [Mongoliibacter ruber]PRY86985.1 hypothetical protein CLW00_10753 [Mongoliibacter ruber]